MARNVIIAQREEHDTTTLGAGGGKRRLDGGGGVGDTVSFCRVRRVRRVHIAKGEVDGLIGAHDFAIAPKEGRGFPSNGRENTVSMVDLGNLKTLARISTGQ